MDRSKRREGAWQVRPVWRLAGAAALSVGVLHGSAVVAQAQDTKPVVRVNNAARPAATALAAAAMRGDLDEVRALIARRADVNAATGDGMSALHWAAAIPVVAQTGRARRTISSGNASSNSPFVQLGGNARRA